VKIKTIDTPVITPLMRTMGNYAFANMFFGCTGLTSIPAGPLPATTLVDRCYSGMSFGCTTPADVGNINAAWFSVRTPTQSQMFRNDTAITTPIAYADIPAAWK
jgi:hypothetical protein